MMEPIDDFTYNFDIKWEYKTFSNFSVQYHYLQIKHSTTLVISIMADSFEKFKF